jgi:hypothetical protein
MWNGLGVNYLSRQTNWASDAQYFKSVGLTGIRPMRLNLTTPWTVGSSAENGLEYWRNCAKYFGDQGFWVMFGGNCPPGSGSYITPEVWEAYTLSLIEDVQYCESQGIKLGCYEIANEVENKLSGITQSEFVDLVKDTATRLKAVCDYKIAHSCWDYNDEVYDAWITKGLGDLDIILPSTYGSIKNGGLAVSLGTYDDNRIIQAFGPDRVMIREFNLDSESSDMCKIPEDVKVDVLRKQYKAIKDMGYKRAMFFHWVGYLDSETDQNLGGFALKNADGSFKNYWSVLLTDNGRITFIN